MSKHHAVLTGGIGGEDFAKVFNDLFAHPEKIEELSRGALSVAKKFDSTAMAKKMVELYESLISSHQVLEEE